MVRPSQRKPPVGGTPTGAVESAFAKATEDKTTALPEKPLRVVWVLDSIERKIGK
jgi:hypothetical protein